MKTKYIFLCLSAGLLIASCSNNEEQVAGGNSPLKVSAGVTGNNIQTRVANETATPTWDTSDYIGITGNGKTNMKYQAATTATSSAFTAAGEGIIVTDATNKGYTAYYPYDGTEGAENNTAKAISVNNTTDYMNASATSNGANVSFTFSHQLAKLTVKVTYDGTTAINGAKWKISDGLYGGNIVQTTGKVTINSTTSSMSTTTSSYLLLPAQTISNGKITVTIGDNDFSASLSGKSISLETGKNTTLTLTAKGKKLSLNNTSIMAWNEGSGNKNAVWHTHSYVVLDTADGIKWATTNLGAEKPADLGYYFSWGATESYLYFDEYSTIGSNNEWSAKNPCGCLKGNMTDDLPATNDIASVQWGDKWKIPTKEQLQKLRDYGSWKWTSQKNSKGETVNGCLVSSTASTSTGKSLFIPITGYYDNGILYWEKWGFYWSSSPSGEIACYLRFNATLHQLLDSDGVRGVGYLARPVYSE